jgi:hypothetical protein
MYRTKKDEMNNFDNNYRESIFLKSFFAFKRQRYCEAMPVRFSLIYRMFRILAHWNSINRI